jgi:hypothetical protein
MTLRKKVASALSFAHLTGFAKAEIPEDDDKDKKAEGDDPKDQDRENGNVKGRRAQEDDESDKEFAEYNDDEDKKDEDKAKKAKSKAEETDDDAEDDDSDEEMRGKSASAAARRRERARCAAIFGSKAAAKNPALAANLAFNTSMTRKEALVVLESSPAPASAAYGDRAARNPGIGAGGELQKNSRQATASNWDKAFAKVAPRR